MEQTPATKYFIYARRSSEGDERQVQSIPAQMESLGEVQKVRQFKVVEIIEESKSAKPPNGRDGFNRMLGDIEKQKADGILVWSLDRLSRNPVDTGRIIDLMDRGLLVEVTTPTQVFRNNPIDKLMMNFILINAKFENDKKGEDVKRGLKTKAERGWLPGPAPVGYLNDPLAEKGNKTVLKDPDRFDKVKRLWEYMLTGQYNPAQLIKIANNEWGLTTPPRGKKKLATKLSRSGVYVLLQNHFYYGVFEYPKGSGNWIQGKHPPMITKNEFLVVQEILSGRSKPRPQKHSFIYAGLFQCGNCGASITPDYKIKKQKNGNIHHYIYGRCTKQKKVKCSEKYIEQKELEKQILEYLKRLQLPKELLDWALDKARAKGAKDKVFNQGLIREKRQRIDELKNDTTDLLKLYSSKDNADRSIIPKEQLIGRKNDIESEVNKLELEIHKLEISISESKEVESFDLAQRAYDKFKDGTPEEKRRIIIDIYEKGVIKNQRLILTLKPIFSLIKEIKSKK